MDFVKRERVFIYLFNLRDFFSCSLKKECKGQESLVWRIAEFLVFLIYEKDDVVLDRASLCDVYNKYIYGFVYVFVLFMICLMGFRRERSFSKS